MVGAGTAAAASDQISDCFLPEGAGSREGKKGGGRGGGWGESCLVPASSPFPFLASMPGHGGVQRCPQQ